MSEMLITIAELCQRTWLQLMCCTLPKHLCPYFKLESKGQRWSEFGWRGSTKGGLRENWLEGSMSTVLVSG